MTFCPKCQSEIDDGVCPKCGEDAKEAAPATSGQGKFRFQFGLPFLFYLVGLTAVTCAISKAAGRWHPAPMIVMSGLLFWRTRRIWHACLPGMAIGFAIPWLFASASEPMVCFNWSTLLGGLNAVAQGEYRMSGLAVVGILTVYVEAAGMF